MNEIATLDRNPNGKRAIARWLVQLSEICAHQTGAAISQGKLADLTEMLAEDFDSSNFDRETLKHVAGANPWFPSYSVIVENLRAFKRNRTETTVVIGNDGGMSAMDQRWLSYWHANVAERRLLQSKLETQGRLSKDFAQHPVAMLASLVRSQSPKAWREIANTDPSVREYER